MSRIKTKCELYGDLVDQTFSQLNENSINNQDSHSQIKNDKTPMAEYPKENYSVDTKKNRPSAIPNFMQKIVDDDIAKSINSLNSKPKQSSSGS